LEVLNNNTMAFSLTPAMADALGQWLIRTFSQAGGLE
jgi:hypothetical protein